jgi:Domain of unknown function (DUF4224)
VSLFVPESCLEELTGLCQPAAQIRWLTRHGWRFVVNAAGRPVVARAEFDQHMVTKPVTVGLLTTNRVEPDWPALFNGG